MKLCLVSGPAMFGSSLPAYLPVGFLILLVGLGLLSGHVRAGGPKLYLLPMLNSWIGHYVAGLYCCWLGILIILNAVGFALILPFCLLLVYLWDAFGQSEHTL
ncbi:hypothetical protein Nepgr_023954 [Nepenthes gracilis]|uniref:Uncharacterized protein n=1 Tax=Nepenthes gracilis TaxID=150966 RepID=A0AAD3XZZ7_NEPGR|nr:hypothetical protein Nepgr_023954 [Nepenthes gracilis]